MKSGRLFVLAALLLFVSAIAPQKPVSRQEAYIAKYSMTAVEEMYRSGVPASITLAQGILESGSGYSELAVKGNNHFGIKCHNWKGKSMKFNDDKPNECFRVYGNASESFRDHSDFLRYNDRYKFLFDYNVTDYKAWAYGLKKAGYATDPSYSQKLIKIIEDYSLFEFDTAEYSEDVADILDDRQIPQEEIASAGETQASKTLSRKEKRKYRKAKQAEIKKEESSAGRRRLPQTPTEIERPKVSERYSYSLSRPVYEVNGVPYIEAGESDTYASIASYYNLFLKELLRFNDLDSARELLPGTVVYIKPKKSQAAAKLPMHVASEGETLYQISQRFAVKMSALQKLNGLEGNTAFREGDVIKLRKK